MKKYSHYIVLFLLIQIYFPALSLYSLSFLLYIIPSIHVLSCTLTYTSSDGPCRLMFWMLVQLVALFMWKGCGAFRKYGLAEGSWSLGLSI